MGSNVCCEPRNYGNWSWNDSSTQNLIFLPKPVRTDYDQIFDQARLLLTELEALRSEFTDARKQLLEIAETKDVSSINNPIKCFMWSISANKNGNFNSKEIHIDRDRAPYIFVKLDEKTKFPPEIYQFEKSLTCYFRIMFTYENHINDILTELQPLDVRLGGNTVIVASLLMHLAMLKCETPENRNSYDYRTESIGVVPLAEDNLKEMRESIRAAKEFRSKLLSEKMGFELNLYKLQTSLWNAKKVGFECAKRKLFTPKEIAEFYLLK